MLLFAKDWLERFMLAADMAPLPEVFACFSEYRPFWYNLPQVFWQLYMRKYVTSFAAARADQADC